MTTKARRSGFTLPEILVTVTVIAVLAAVVVPAVTQFASKGDGPATLSDLNALKTAVTGYVTSTRAYPTYLSDVSPYASINLGTTATSGTTYVGAGYGFTVGSTFSTTADNGTNYLTVSLSSPKVTTKKCSEIDADLDSGTGGTSGAFRYASDVAPCAAATYFLMPK